MKPITLFTVATPNGQKVSNMLEELKAVYNSKTGFDYEAKPISFGENEQKSEWFLKVCPNGRIPAITDPNKPGVDGGSDGFHVFETAAILLYLQEHYDPDNVFNFGQADGQEAALYRSQALQWMCVTRRADVGSEKWEKLKYPKYP